MKLNDKFIQLKNEKRAAFIAYVPFGFPTVAKSKEIIIALQDAGVDIIELGLPFSDPLADGPIIQAACQEALANGANADKLFTVMNELKSRVSVPIVIMTYLNPVLQFGVEKFLSAMDKNDMRGIMLVDSPIEENKDYMLRARKHNISTVCFVTPVTPVKRIKEITDVASGFIYYISVTGTTGPRALKFDKIAKHISLVRKFSTLPVCVGFGIHSREQVKSLGEISDGAIVGSAIVRFISENHTKKDFIPLLKGYVSSLCTK